MLNQNHYRLITSFYLETRRLLFGLGFSHFLSLLENHLSFLLFIQVFTNRNLLSTTHQSPTS